MKTQQDYKAINETYYVHMQTTSFFAQKYALLMHTHVAKVQLVGTSAPFTTILFQVLFSNYYIYRLSVSLLCKYSQKVDIFQLTRLNTLLTTFHATKNSLHSYYTRDLLGVLLFCTPFPH